LSLQLLSKEDFMKHLTKTIASAIALSATVLATSQVQAQSATYAIDPTHTFVNFEVKHFGTSTNRGRWDKKEGSITIDRAAKTGKAEINIDMASINTGTAPFDGHLKSADFFDVANNPTGKFVGTNFKFDGDKVVEVSGDLTLRGKTGPVTLKSVGFSCYQHPRLQREVCGGDFETTIQRSLWGISFGVANNAIPDMVRLEIQVEAVKQ
jgi:polyisoprenoid-binding protein YceI